MAGGTFEVQGCRHVNVYGEGISPADCWAVFVDEAAVFFGEVRAGVAGHLVDEGFGSVGSAFAFGVYAPHWRDICR